MQRSYFHIVVCCFLLLTTVFVFAEDHKTKAGGLWDDYTDANQNAMAASTNYNTQVDAAKEIKEDIDANDDTLSDTTQATLRNLFIAGGLYVIGAPTVFIPALGQVKPTLDMVNAWLDSGDLEKLKVVAEQAASDAHRESVKYDTARDTAYNDYTTQYKKENPDSEPKAPLVDVKHKVYAFECYGGCGVSWDNVEAARDTHKAAETCGASGVLGCGQSYYTCDSDHQVFSCANFSCPISFRPCSNGRCYATGSYSAMFRHSASGSVTPDEELPKGSNICPKCKKSHGSGSGS